MTNDALLQLIEDAEKALAAYDAACEDPDTDPGYHKRIDTAIDCIEPLRVLLGAVRRSSDASHTQTGVESTTRHPIAGSAERRAQISEESKRRYPSAAGKSDGYRETGFCSGAEYADAHPKSIWGYGPAHVLYPIGGARADANAIGKISALREGAEAGFRWARENPAAAFAPEKGEAR